MKFIAAFFGLLFLLFSYFQLNDPDPQIWIPVYSAAALACYMGYRGLWPGWVFYGLAAAYLIGAVIQWPPEFEGVFFGGLEMRSLNIELARESLGLGICALVMAFLGWQAGR
ncbi:MAG: transmembrane 220 family protein [Bacteroidetes bacterium]|nr:transmembrane 220 family protein [Bacteroidota bacterium]